MLLSDMEKDLSDSHRAGKTSGCMFCQINISLIVSETENFYLIRDLFPIINGHMMIVSKNHFGCMGELPISSFKEVEKLKKDFNNYFRRQTLYVGYEHGRAGHCVKLKGSQVTCHHFHLHYLPLNVDIRPTLARHYSPRPVNALADVPSLFQQFGEYLYFETTDRKGYFYPASTAVESHLLRTLICNASGLSDRADWETL